MSASNSNVPTSFPSLNAHIVLLTTFILFLLPMASSDYFQFPNFYPATTDSNARYQGNAVMSAGAVEFYYSESNVGWVTYAQNVQLWDAKTAALSDFTTNFSFTIDTQVSAPYGDGLAFFLAPVGFQIPPNSEGGYLGLFDPDAEEHQIVFVEFDSYQNEWDPNYTHIGINHNAIGSLTTTPWNASLHSGERCDASIAYNASTKNLSVFWSYGENSNSSLFNELDLMDILPERVMIGFSASTSFAAEKTTLESWAYSSSLSGKHAKDTKLTVGIPVSVGVLIFGALILIGSVVVRKRRCVRREKTEKTNLTSINDDLERGAGPRSGRKSVDPTNGESEIGLVEWVWNLYGRGQILSAVDERVKSDSDSKEVERLLIVGLWCAYPDHSLRPSMRQAIQVLQFDAEMPHLPVKMPVPMYHVPGVGTSRPEEPQIHSGGASISCSIIEMGR
ncbi:hypothetical protein Vadar_028851 [Vaccinium darrowii]|uniref:Uncharacterized protein n=1 Tax=Vaccinium darrowii TaxID=229202 RepID=A0ACB7Z7S5_9ERIC|nr:hypothetical protein Vadar_028851 [Vaccinium darrowii]